MDLVGVFQRRGALCARIEAVDTPRESSDNPALCIVVNARAFQARLDLFDDRPNTLHDADVRDVEVEQSPRGVLVILVRGVAVDYEADTLLCCRLELHF